MEIQLKKKTKIAIGCILIGAITISTISIIFFTNNDDFDYNSETWKFPLDVNDYPSSPLESGWQLVAPGNIPITNPLKGFMPYKGDYSTFPYSLEYTYIPVNEVVAGSSSTFDFSVIEYVLNDVTSRGNQLVFRLYFDYPDKETAVPQYLIDDGLTMNEYDEFGGGYSPDYDDSRMRELMENLIIELGNTYDGDPRIGYIQIGLLGHWGEWHTYPHEEWFANVMTQNLVLTTFDNSFNTTKILARYADEVTNQYNIGFHDDSFAYCTLRTEGWCFQELIVDAGMENQWKSEPIGGEVRPEIQVDAFKQNPADAEDIDDCIAQTHASWMLITSIFHPNENYYGNLDEDKMERAAEVASQMGYIFAVCYSKTDYNAGEDILNWSVLLHNFGVAPFYYNWSIEIGILDNQNQTIFTKTTSETLDDILSDTSEIWNFTLADASSYTPNAENLALKVKNPLDGGKPVYFANQRITNEGWIIIEDFIATNE
ncbi:MAG: DUF4832 domain-containing protein [Candidatus Lokiarchaeota archaeon]|nr:DUF4832 domain-containing protein [Candidatus Lokiarchaeota archaeon]